MCIHVGSMGPTCTWGDYFEKPLEFPLPSLKDSCTRGDFCTFCHFCTAEMAKDGKKQVGQIPIGIILGLYWAYVKIMEKKMKLL